jgi:hypothetical protein
MTAKKIFSIMFFNAHFLIFFFSSGTGQSCILLAAGVDSSTASGSLVNAENGLNTSKRLITLIDPSISNLGSAEHEKIFKQIIIEDFQAQIFLKQFQYSKSYRKTRKAHEKLTRLSQDFTKKYLTETNSILNNFASEIIQSKDIRAKHYLQLGYRDLSLAEQIAAKADYISPGYLYSMRCEQYLKAILTIKRAMRYCFLAIIETRTAPRAKRGIENLAFEEMGAKLWDTLQKNRSRLISIHFDNYNKYRLSSFRESYIKTEELKKEITKGTAVDTPTAR